MSSTLPIHLYDTKRVHSAKCFVAMKRHPFVEFAKRVGAVRFEQAGRRIRIYAGGFMVGRGRTVLKAMDNAMLRLNPT